ncbi:MAG: hypothetical protein IH840_03075 [Candidatus Heimdallarchaeota archaeon]|nr:hypothetical protein [Candidatus Heimdallarchaeota archaeon]
MINKYELDFDQLVIDSPFEILFKEILYSTVRGYTYKNRGLTLRYALILFLEQQFGSDLIDLNDPKVDTTIINWMNQ